MTNIEELIKKYPNDQDLGKNLRSLYLESIKKSEKNCKCNCQCKEKYKNSKIVCAAMWFKDGNIYNHQPKNIDSGIVIAGMNYQNCYLTGFKSFDIKEYKDLKKVHGFLTSDNFFVDQKQAAKIAFNSKQINEIKDELNPNDLNYV